MIDQRTIGLYDKFNVSRKDWRDKPGGDREGAKYFVLDMTYDPFAKRAIEAYVTACIESHPLLALDLIRKYGLTNMELPR